MVRRSRSIEEEELSRAAWARPPVRVRSLTGTRTHYTFAPWAEAAADMGCCQVSTWCHRDGFPDPHPQPIDVVMDADCKQCLRELHSYVRWFPDWHVSV